MEKYTNRKDAGQRLAVELQKYKDNAEVIVLALPRGGVPIGYEIAQRLSVPLDVFIVRKLGMPGAKELAMGAIATGGVKVFNEHILKDAFISQHEIEAVIAEEQQELTRRERLYRGKKPPLSIENKIVILVDDGIATGASMRAAIKALRTMRPKKLIVAVPVAEEKICQEFAKLADEFYCPLQPKNFYSVGVWYESFEQTEDDEVANLLS